MDAAKLLFVFLLIVIALRKKLSVGITLFGAGLVTAVLYQVGFNDLTNGYWELLQSRKFISLTSVVLLITFLGSLLKELKYLDRLSAACQGLYGGNRTAVALLPPLVGLMPMPGGSLLSAPLVNNVLTDKGYKPEFRTATNYWMRHVVEFFWPVYPGIILTEAMTGMPILSVSLMQASVGGVTLLIGLSLFIRKIDVGNNNNGNHLMQAITGILGSVWPIVVAILIYGVLRIELAFAVLITLAILIVVAKPTWPALRVSLKKGLSYKLVMLIFGTLSFQTVLELAGAIESIPAMAATFSLPDEIVIFLVCFTVGILTGMVAAYIALGYAILAGFLFTPVYNPGYILIAYSAGFMGVMLSPSHLCLILTNDYFGSDLGKVYRKIIPAVILVGIGCLAVYLTGFADLFLPG